MDCQKVKTGQSVNSGQGRVNVGQIGYLTFLYRNPEWPRKRRSRLV